MKVRQITAGNVATLEGQLSAQYKGKNWPTGGASRFDQSDAVQSELVPQWFSAEKHFLLLLDFNQNYSITAGIQAFVEFHIERTKVSSRR